MQASTEMVKNKGKKCEIPEHIKVFALALRNNGFETANGFFLFFFKYLVGLKEAHVLLKNKSREKRPV